jgi:hypothetical protein
MLIKLIGRVTDKFVTDTGTAYLTFLDTEQGGLIKLAVPGGENLKIDDKLDLQAQVKPGLGKGGLYLRINEIMKGGENK